MGQSNIIEGNLSKGCNIKQFEIPPIPEPSGYCGACKEHYKGNFTNHGNCKSKKRRGDF